MSGSPVQQLIDERERRRLLRRKGWTQCLESLGFACIGGLAALISWWFFDFRYLIAVYVPLAFGLFYFIAGLVNLVKGRDRPGPKDIS